ncbi:hypothetical protein JTE90_000648 [Oedothorax gibbosus]|uniref:Uncharacterized protein n=1 Tax=Oedothorax gibbosus TaxID=931172 RepID=A0AAV6VUF7_9ARAC|nr:hypothetical protein JTE90_000648 [Oedothorax gibbosus]
MVTRFRPIHTPPRTKEQDINGTWNCHQEESSFSEIKIRSVGGWNRLAPLVPQEKRPQNATNKCQTRSGRVRSVYLRSSNYTVR